MAPAHQPPPPKVALAAGGPAYQQCKVRHLMVCWQDSSGIDTGSLVAQRN